MTTDSPLLLAALAHAAAGRPVFPCARSGPHAKRPLVKAGFKAATCDPAQIRAWWTQHPDALIAMPTGPESNLWAFDIDVSHDKPGLASLAALEQAHAPLPDTIRVTTASGGRHYWFRYPSDRKVITRTAVAEGIDTRGFGGYVIVPPSTSDVGTWQFDPDTDPADGVAPADAPAWLLDLVCAEVHPRAAAAAEGAPVQPAPTHSSTDGGTFFAKINSKALHNLAAWVPTLFPGAKPYHDGYRVTSHALGRKLEEDLSLMPTGIQDFGEERGKSYGSRGLTPIDVVLAWGPPTKPLDAALWLCAQCGIAPAALGWADRPAPRPGANRRTDREPAALEPPPPPPDDPGPTGDPRGTPERPTIHVRNGETPQLCEQSEALLQSSRAGIYKHGTRLVRAATWDTNQAPRPELDITRYQGTAFLYDISPFWLLNRLARAATWQRFDARSQSWRTIDPPRRIADTLLALQGEWTFPVLTGFCESPTLTPNGRLITDPGYDPDSGLFLNHALTLDPIDLNPADRWEQAAEAAEFLMNLYSDIAAVCFPFVTPADRAAAVAMTMTAVLRRLLKSAPLCGISASSPATGKSLLADCVAMIATGRPASVLGLGDNEIETEKRIDACLMDGDSLVLIDNVSRAVKSDTLCQVTTQESKTCRVLGLSKKIECPTNATWIMTGNNLTFLGDLTERVLLIRLDAGVERPAEREFKVDAVTYIQERRPQIIRAVLLIAKAYIEAGRPPVKAPACRFPQWDALIRRAMIWAGCPDPLITARDLREDDQELTAMADLLAAWYQRFQSKPTTAAELMEAARETTIPFSGPAVPMYPELAESVTMLLGDSKGAGSAKDLGYKLRHYKGRIFRNLRIGKETGSRRAGVRWYVEPLTPP